MSAELRPVPSPVLTGPWKTSNDGPLVVAGEAVALGEERDLELTLAHDYSGVPVRIPLRVWRGPEPGPTLLITAALHGDELNGTGIVRALAARRPFELRRGSLVLVPVINLLGFERHSRYMPDRRDLNRCFPGSPDGSLAKRFAHAFFQGVVQACDLGIDLHTAALRRTNFPNVRARLRDPVLAALAPAFGTELVVNNAGPDGSLRATATRAGCPTLLLEAGEVWKMEPSVVELGLRGISNVVFALGMAEGELRRPPYQALIQRKTWVRADRGGLLRFHVAPGDLLRKGQPIATNTDFFGRERNVLEAPRAGIVLGMTTIPAVAPGDAVCHLATPKGGMTRIRRALRGLGEEHALHERLREDLATSLAVTEPGE